MSIERLAEDRPEDLLIDEKKPSHGVIQKLFEIRLRILLIVK